MRMHSQLTISNTMALRRSSEKSRIWCQVLHYAVSSVNRSNIKFQVRTRDRRIAGIFFLSVKPTLFLKTPAFLTSSSHTLGIRLYNPTSKFVQTLGDFVQRCEGPGFISHFERPLIVFSNFNTHFLKGPSLFAYNNKHFCILEPM